MEIIVAQQHPPQTLGGPPPARILQRQTDSISRPPGVPSLRARAPRRTLITPKTMETTRQSCPDQPRPEAITSRKEVTAAVVEVGQRPRASEDIEHHGTVEETKVPRDPLMELMASMGNIDEKVTGEGLIESQDHLGEDIPLLSEQHIANALQMEHLRM